MLQSLSHTLIIKGEWGKGANLLGLLIVSCCNIFLELCSKRNGLDFFHFIFIYYASVCSTVMKPRKTPTSPLCLWKPWGLVWHTRWVTWEQFLGSIIGIFMNAWLIDLHTWYVLSLYSAQLEPGSCFGWEPHLLVPVWSALSPPWAGGRGRVAWGCDLAYNGAKRALLLAASLSFASPCRFFCPSKGCGFFRPGKFITKQQSHSCGIQGKCKMSLL